MTRDHARPAPPPEMVAAAERDYRAVSHELAVLIETIRAVRSPHQTELDLFMHLYATIRPTTPPPARPHLPPSPS